MHAEYVSNSLPCTSISAGSLVLTSNVVSVIGITAKHVILTLLLSGDPNTLNEVPRKSFAASNVTTVAESSNPLSLRSPSIRTPSISQMIREPITVQLNIANPLSETFTDRGWVTIPVVCEIHTIVFCMGFNHFIVTYSLFVILLSRLLLKEDEAIYIKIGYRVQYWWTSSRTVTRATSSRDKINVLLPSCTSTSWSQTTPSAPTGHRRRRAQITRMLAVSTRQAWCEAGACLSDSRSDCHPDIWYFSMTELLNLELPTSRW